VTPSPPAPSSESGSPRLGPASPHLVSPDASAAATDGAIRIPLSGAAPSAIVLDGDRAWVLAVEGGTLMDVDLAERREARSFPVGFGATHLALTGPGTAAVGRFDDGDNGWYLILLDLESGALDGVRTGELGALAGGEDGVVWALEKADALVKVDARTARIIDRVAVNVGGNVHMEVQWGAGSAWVGSDATPTIRLSGTDLAASATIAVPTGIPFRFTGGLLWGAGPTALWAIDPTTNEVTREVPLRGVSEILGLDVDPAADEAWLAVRRTGGVGAVLRLDLQDGLVAEEHAVALPAAVSIAPERAWVASYLSNELIGFAR
jgi:hypothetical protein